MVKGRCPRCDKIIIEDVDEYEKKYPEEKEVQCPYCNQMMRLKK